MNEKKNNKANGTNGAYRAPLESKPFLPKGDLAIDKMVQAARSCKQNIAAGLIGLMSLMTLMGCSSDSHEPEVVDDVPVVETGTAIAFLAEQGAEESVTRAATSLHDKGVNAFKVWGFKNMSYDDGTGYDRLQTVMPSYTVRWYNNSATTTTTNTHGWEYVNQQSSGQEEQTIKFWDWGATAYRFFAVADPTNGANNPYTATMTGNNYEVTVDVDATSEAGIEATPYYSLLWFSTGNAELGHKPFGQPVQLEFLKPISRVRYMFIYEKAEDALYTTLAGKLFGPSDPTARIHRKGTAKITYPLKGTGTAESFEVVSRTDAGIPAFDQDYYEAANDIDAYKWYDVLPTADQGAYQGAYTLTVMVNGVEKTASVPAAFMVWKPGYQYTYIFKVHVDGGVSIDAVQSAFTPWTSVSLGNHTMYNW